METATIYKGVELKGNRTEAMIDFMIDNRSKGDKKLNAVELAAMFDFPNFRPVNAILRLLNTEFGVILEPTKKKSIKRVKMAKNTYKNYKGIGKEAARDLIAKAVMSTKRQSSNVLTLPADSWLMEKNIIEKKSGYKFTAVERDKETYKRMVKNLIKNDELFDSVISTANKSIGEVIVNDIEDTYSCAILDYCGFIDSFYNEINDVMKRNLVKKGGYIAITLAENDRAFGNVNFEGKCGNKFVEKCCVEGEDFNGAKVTKDLVNFLVFSNDGYQITNKFSYSDTKSKMLLFIIKRNE